MSQKGHALSEQNNGADWYILKGETQTGPFSLPDMVRMLQNKEAFTFDMVWKTGWEDWKRIGETGEFAPDRIRAIAEETGEKVFIERAHTRAPFQGSVYVHNHLEIWKGRGVEVGEGGAGLLVQSSVLLPGDQVVLHFRPEGDMPAFNVRAEIVNKMWNGKVRTKDAVIKYDLKFLDLEAEARAALKGYTRGAKKTA